MTATPDLVPAVAVGSEDARAIDVLLVSTYEMGHQPLGLAMPAAALRAAGHRVRSFDLSVETPSPDTFRRADLVAISIPMHTAARLGVELAQRVRRLNPAAHIAFYGLYASPLHDRLTGPDRADTVIGGEYEVGLVTLADRLADPSAGRDGGAGALIEGFGASPVFPRQHYPLPERSGLPSLDRYAQLSDEGGLRLAGYVETTRGCAHTCTHCPITPVYGGRLRLVQQETVLGDIDQLVAQGAGHITFGDPDFLNAVPHALAIVEELHRRHPDVTYDVTIKVEHLVEHEAVLPRLRDTGCLFITSAFESCNDAILGYLDKGHTLADMEHVLRVAQRERLVLRPTWVAFTPWTALEDFLAMLEFIERHGLVRHVQPVQYALRLLLPPGSPLVTLLEAQRLLGRFDEEHLTYTWASPDPAVDALQARLATIVEEAASPIEGAAHSDEGPPPVEDPEVTFARVKQAALEAAGRPPSAPLATQPREVVPGLTEAWFC